MPDPLLDPSTAALVLYSLVLFCVFVDGFFPVMPGETTVSACVTYAVSHDIAVLPMLPLAFIGAIAGDSVAYWYGHRGGAAMKGWLERKSGKHVVQQSEQLFDRNATITIALDRMLPGIRFAVCVIAGARPMPYRHFAPLQAIGAGIWAFQAVTVAYLVNQAFDAGFIVASILNMALGTLFGLVVVIRERRFRRANPNWRLERPDPQTL